MSWRLPVTAMGVARVIKSLLLLFLTLQLHNRVTPSQVPTLPPGPRVCSSDVVHFDGTTLLREVLALNPPALERSMARDPEQLTARRPHTSVSIYYCHFLE